jgi:SAM-dependent methyltransferase
MSFGAIADDYDRLRPRPPEAAVDWLLPEHCRVAVDLAAGTGLLTRALARKVPQVIAIEPDERMAAVLRARSAGAGDPRPAGVRVMLGRGESIPLPDASADGVFVSSAWHWLDHERAIPEIARVLRDHGRLGLIWTSRDRESGWFSEAGWFGGSGRPGEPASGQPDGAVSGGPDAQRDGAAWPRHRRHEVALPAGSSFGPSETASFAFQRAMTISDFLGLLATYSGVITAAPQDRQAGLARARDALEQRFPGASEIDVPMRAWCWRADRLARPGSAGP